MKWLKEMNNFFIESIENLDIEPHTEEIINESNSVNIVKNIVRKFSHHPSILKIKDYVKITHKISFKTTLDHEFQTQINKLDPKRAAWKMIFLLRFLWKQMRYPLYF